MNNRVGSVANAFVLFSLALLSSRCAGAKSPEPDTVSSGSITSALGASTGEVVAKLGVEAPAASEFILRATMPILKGAFDPEKNPYRSFGVLNGDGSLAEKSQVETVSRYATGEPEIVEILARVKKPSGAALGSLLEYRVVALSLSVPIPSKPPSQIEASYQASLLEVGGTVSGLLASPNSILLHATDVFGNSYGFSVLKDSPSALKEFAGPAEFLRFGSVGWSVKSYGTLSPVAGHSNPKTAKSHLLGVHVFPSIWANENFLTLDLQFHNGHIGDPTNPIPLHPAFFSKIELILPKGWTALADFPDSFFGPLIQDEGVNRIAIVRPNSDGKMHAIQAQGQFHRRLALVPVGLEASGKAFLEEQGRGFVRPEPGLFSWWNPLTSRYFPQKGALPSLDYLGISSVKSDLQSQLSLYKTVLEKGTPGGLSENGALGWANPAGDPYGGATSGVEIGFHVGIETAFAASTAGYRVHQAMQRMYTDRQPVALYKEGGAPAHVVDFLEMTPSGMGYLPFEYFVVPDGSKGKAYFGLDDAPDSHESAVTAQGKKPSYYTALFSYMPIDFQHLVRFTRNAKVLVYLGNDSISRTLLQQQAAAFDLSYHPWANNSGGYLQGSGFAHDKKMVDENPGKGVSHGRGEGWGLDVRNVAYATGDEAWRAQGKFMYDQLIDTLAKAQIPCTGAIGVNEELLQGYRKMRHWEDCINFNGLRGALENVYDGTGEALESKLESMLKKGYYSLLSPMLWAQVGSKKGPWFEHAVGPKSLSESMFCSATPATSWIDSYYIKSWLGYGFLATGDSAFLDAASQIAGGGMAALKASLTSPTANMENQAVLLQILQSAD